VIACPKCGLPGMAVSETRLTKSGARRRRKCVCGHHVTTLEAIVHGPTKTPIDDVVLVRRSALNALVKAMTTLLSDRSDVADLIVEAGEDTGSIDQALTVDG